MSTARQLRRLVFGGFILGGLVLSVGLLPVSVAAQAATERPAALERLDAYVGVWDAEAQVAPDGRGFHFVYSLTWFDARRTIVEMLITQRFDTGEERVLWKGFKGWDRADGGVYYHGFSPGGRSASGEVREDGLGLVTEYRGWAPAGPVNNVRDDFSPVTDGSFTSITFLERDGTWQEASRDRWTRRTGS